MPKTSPKPYPLTQKPNLVSTLHYNLNFFLSPNNISWKKKDTKLVKTPFKSHLRK